TAVSRTTKQRPASAFVASPFFWQAAPGVTSLASTSSAAQPPAPASLPPAVRSATYIVIAAFNEGRAIANGVDGLRRGYCNVVVVDDGSADDTAQRAAEAGATVLRHMINRGQGAALQTGISYALRAGAQYIVTFDAD